MEGLRYPHNKNQTKKFHSMNLRYVAKLTRSLRLSFSDYYLKRKNTDRLLKLHKNETKSEKLSSSDDRVVSASASRAVDFRLIPSRLKSVTVKLVFTAFLLDALH